MGPLSTVYYVMFFSLRPPGRPMDLPGVKAACGERLTGGRIDQSLFQVFGIDSG